MIIIKYKKCHQDAKDLVFTPGNVGVDIASVEDVCVEPNERELIRTGIKINMPKCIGIDDKDINDAYDCSIGQTLMAKIEGRSGLAMKKGVFPIGGIIDPSYCGEIYVILFNSDRFPFIVKSGDRIAQLVFYTCLAGQQIHFTEHNDEWQKTERDEKGFGSSGI